MKKPLTANSYVCEDHFQDADIIKWDETRLANGTVHRLERIIKKLKDGAIPIAVRKETSVVSEEQFGNNPDCGTMDLDVPENVDSAVEIQPIEIPESTATHNKPKLTFESLLKSYRNFKLPNERWAGIVDDEANTVTFLSVRKEILRRIKISEDLSIQILLDEIPVRVKRLSHSITSEKDIVQLINYLDSMAICENFKDAKRLLHK